MTAESLYAAIVALLEKCQAFPDQELRVHVVANAKAGGFTRPKMARAHQAEIDALLAEAATLAPRSAPLSHNLFITGAAGQAYDHGRRLLEESRGLSGQTLVILASGDGTHWEFLNSLMECDESLRSRVAVLRLPMGTGNDASDGQDLSQSLGRLIRGARIQTQSAVVVSGPSLTKTMYSFNIASIGLDAYVTHMTNKLKGFMPGDSYHAWLDIAALFYDWVYRVRPMRLSIGLKGGAQAEWRERGLLMAMGASGGRSYGSHVPILPGEENLIAVRQTSLGRKLKIKVASAKGLHAPLAEVSLWRADRVKVEYQGKILLQLDGETVELDAGSFPLTLELSPPCIRVLGQA